MFDLTVPGVAAFLANVAVIVTVVYLALQIRQAARNQRAIMDRGRSQQVSDWLQFISGPDIAPLVLRGYYKYSELTDDERHRFRWCVYPLFLHYEDSFLQHKNGMISEAQWESIRSQMTDTSRLTGLRKVWCEKEWGEVRLFFHVQFRDFLDAIFAETADKPTN